MHRYLLYLYYIAPNITRNSNCICHLQKSRAICIPIAIFIGNCIYLSSGLFLMLGHQYEAYEHVLYFTLNRLVWSILISYGIIGHGLSGFGKLVSNSTYLT